MKKVLNFLSAIIFVSLIVSCSSFLSDKSELEKSGEKGSIILNLDDLSDNQGERSLDLSTIKNISYSVSSSDITTITGTKAVETSDGKGSIKITDVLVGSNRIVSITAEDENNTSIKGFEISEVIDVKSGDNSINNITWITTAKANVYKKLLEAGNKINSFTDSQNTWIENAVPNNTVAYLVDIDSIVSDFASLKSGGSYLLAYGTVSFNSQNANGYKVCVNDPSSESFTISSDGENKISDVAPGKWDVLITDKDNVVTKKQVTVTSGNDYSLGVLGNPLKDKLFIFVKASSAPTIWAWESNSGLTLSESLGETWPGTAMSAATSVYMNVPSGWYMKDFTSSGSLKGTGTISFKLNGSDPELTSGKTATFWYDGDKYYDSDPTETELSSDTSLSKITVNGTTLAASTTSYTIANSDTTAIVSAVATDSKSTVVVSPNTETSIDAGSSKNFVITVTAEDGSIKTYTLSVERAASLVGDVSLKSIKVNNTNLSVSSGVTSYVSNLSGSGDSLGVTVVATPTSSAASVTVSPSVETSIASGSSKPFTITVTNSPNVETYTVTVNYSKVESSQYYWTNKNNAVGTNKTISSWSDWTSAEQIAQCAAYDDPRTWKGIQEVPYDVYALYAAYDDTNLYVMVELTNIADDSIFMSHSYAGSDNAWWDNRNIPLGMIFNTGSNLTTKPTIVAKQEPIWGAADFSDSNGFNYLLYHSSKYGYAEHKSSFVGVGTPGFFKADSSGFNYTEDVGCFSVNSGAPGSEVAGSSGISIRYNRGCAVSGSNIYYESTPTDNRATSEQTGQSLLASNTYSKVSSSHDTGLDMSYWYTIPLSTIGMTKATLESKGIGIRQLTTNGGSLMDCSPWDVSMVDNATEECSDDTSTSKEKEDVDEIISAQARIGHM